MRWSNSNTVIKLSWFLCYLSKCKQELAENILENRLCTANTPRGELHISITSPETFTKWGSGGGDENALTNWVWSLVCCMNRQSRKRRSDSFRLLNEKEKTSKKLWNHVNWTNITIIQWQLIIINCVINCFVYLIQSYFC